MSKETKNTELTLEDLSAQVKKRHGVTKEVYAIQLTDEDGQELTGWIRKPNLDEMGAFISMGQNNPVQATQVLLNSVWLEGDESIRQDEDNFMGAMSVIDEIIQIRVATIKKF